jgi:hypothetical protein
MSQIFDCLCGLPVRIYDNGDPLICKECDVANRFFVLRLAVELRWYDTRIADLLVRLSSYETDDATIGVS